MRRPGSALDASSARTESPTLILRRLQSCARNRGRPPFAAIHQAFRTRTDFCSASTEVVCGSCARLPRLREALDRGEELLALLRRHLRVPRGKRVVDAVGDVVVENLERHPLEGVPYGADLRQDVDAVAVLVDHPLDPAYLPFYPVQALLERAFVVTVLHSVHLPRAAEAAEPQ